jgi:hypothetical protein
MAFEEVDIVEGASSEKTGVSVGLVKMRSAPAKLRVIIREETFAEMGFALADRFKLLLGSGEHHGIIRLRKDKSGTAKASERSFTGGVTAYMINLQHRAEFVDRTERAVPCQWEKIDLTTVEIILPRWADETGPKARARVPAKPSAMLAAEKEQQRKNAEQAQADERRRQRDLADLEVEALRQIKDAIATRREFVEGLHLSPTEDDLLRIFTARPGQLITRESIMTLLYLSRPDDAPEEKIIDVHISKIRKKLPAAVEIRTLHGQGWRLLGNVSCLFELEAA